MLGHVGEHWVVMYSGSMMVSAGVVMSSGDVVNAGSIMVSIGSWCWSRGERRVRDGECSVCGCERCALGSLWSCSSCPCIAVCPPGWFGQDCQQSCSCGNEGHCHPVTGTCSCAPGWTGHDCRRGTVLHSLRVIRRRP